jgi:hypothetical protein
MCPLPDKEQPAADKTLYRGRPHGTRLGRHLRGLNRRDEGQRVGKVSTERQEGQGFPQRHHEDRRPRGQRIRARVQEREGRPCEQGRECHGIEQEVQGYEQGPRVLPIQRHARGSLER